jgi:hypothetical protein
MQILLWEGNLDAVFAQLALKSCCKSAFIYRKSLYIVGLWMFLPNCSGFNPVLSILTMPQNLSVVHWLLDPPWLLTFRPLDKPDLWLADTPSCEL